MKHFCVITNSDKDKEYKTANYIREYLESKGKICKITRNCQRVDSHGRHYTDESEIPDGTQCIIVLGGDGTIIQAASDLIHKDIPILGVNLGTLGFLAEVESNHVNMALENLCKDEYRIESRMMLKGVAILNGERHFCGYALNDIVISRGGLGHLISVNLYVNGELIDKYIGDGIIVSTPTGSTGYNLSAGGPVLTPEIKAMVISPICPHSLNKRSLVVSAQDKIILKIGKCKDIMDDEGVAIVDGRIVDELRTGDSMEIIHAAVDTKLVKLMNTNFFEILYNKIGKEKE